jgi:ribosomal protein S27AE
MNKYLARFVDEGILMRNAGRIRGLYALTNYSVECKMDKKTNTELRVCPTCGSSDMYVGYDSCKNPTFDHLHYHEECPKCGHEDGWVVE